MDGWRGWRWKDGDGWMDRDERLEMDGWMDGCMEMNGDRWMEIYEDGCLCAWREGKKEGTKKGSLPADRTQGTKDVLRVCWTPTSLQK